MAIIVSPVRPVLDKSGKRKARCPLSFDQLHDMAMEQNVVLDRICRTMDGVRYRYDLYSNTHFVGEDFETLMDVWSALAYDPCFQKEKKND